VQSQDRLGNLSRDRAYSIGGGDSFIVEVQVLVNIDIC
jgi:hypothetical protein